MLIACNKAALHSDSCVIQSTCTLLNEFLGSNKAQRTCSRHHNIATTDLTGSVYSHQHSILKCVS